VTRAGGPPMRLREGPGPIFRVPVKASGGQMARFSVFQEKSPTPEAGSG
jgi:hypothetical protein